jgi:hypothetical protein
MIPECNTYRYQLERTGPTRLVCHLGLAEANGGDDVNCHVNFLIWKCA